MLHKPSEQLGKPEKAPRSVRHKQKKTWRGGATWGGTDGCDCDRGVSGGGG